MLTDPLLKLRAAARLDAAVDLAEREIHRTHWDRAFHGLAWFHHHRFTSLRETWRACEGDLVAAFRRLQDAGLLEIITTAATHAVLPLLAGHHSTLRAQILTARDDHRRLFGRDPRGLWLPECAYAEGVERVLQEADVRWFLMDTHGLLHARPRPRYGVFAPVYTPNGVAAFARDLESARQVWSRHEGYPGDGRYRDFYRDIGFDLDLDYVRPALPAPEQRGFTGIKYHRIAADAAGEKRIYGRDEALAAADEHAAHFVAARREQVRRLAGVLDRPPLLVCPYDAELFGHWWYEGPEFLDRLVRRAVAEPELRLVTPSEHLREQPTLQVAAPSASSWGEEGYYRVWLNETNEWILPHLDIAAERMENLARRHPDPDPLTRRALNQATRELLLAQASDWPFILRTGTSPGYAAARVKEHLLRFIALHEQLTATRVNEPWLAEAEARDNVFPAADYRYWA
jgi:1,4-alpha-glucan branching enzyme